MISFPTSLLQDWYMKVIWLPPWLGVNCPCLKAWYTRSHIIQRSRLRSMIIYFRFLSGCKNKPRVGHTKTAVPCCHGSEADMQLWNLQSFTAVKKICDVRVSCILANKAAPDKAKCLSCVSYTCSLPNMAHRSSRTLEEWNETWRRDKWRKVRTMDLQIPGYSESEDKRERSTVRR